MCQGGWWENQNERPFKSLMLEVSIASRQCAPSTCKTENVQTTLSPTALLEQKKKDNFNKIKRSCLPKNSSFHKQCYKILKKKNDK